MKFDFTTILNRKGHDAMAVDLIPYPGIKPKAGFPAIPMWVADMNYPTCPAIIEAVEKRLHEPHFGYFEYPQAYFDAIINWQKTRNDFEVAKENIGYENGVLGGVASALEILTLPGEPVLVHSPCYIGFTHTLHDNGRPIIHSELKRDEEGIWRMDFEDMDAKIKAHNIHTVIFCSPHNPTGRVWEPWEVEKAMEVYKNNNCTVISDEIWSDIIMPGYSHTPTQSVSEDAKNRTIALYAPSKTFSLAGLVGSYHVIFNPVLKDRMRRAAGKTHYNNGNVLSVHALIGAFSKDGMEWTDELNEVLAGNLDYALKQIDAIDGLEASRPQGTYMIYIDASKWLQDHNMTLEELLHKGVEYGVIWQNGEPFGMKNTIRLNIALPLSKVKEAFDRLNTYVFNKETGE